MTERPARRQRVTAAAPIYKENRVTHSDPIVELAERLHSAASALAIRGDVAQTAEPDRVLYALAGTLGSLVAPVTAVGGRSADPAAADAAVEALRAAARAVRALRAQS